MVMMLFILPMMDQLPKLHMFNLVLQQLLLEELKKYLWLTQLHQTLYQLPLIAIIYPILLVVVLVRLPQVTTIGLVILGGQHLQQL